MRNIRVIRVNREDSDDDQYVRKCASRMCMCVCVCVCVCVRARAPVCMCKCVIIILARACVSVLHATLCGKNS
jgi:hypothetical protein